MKESVERAVAGLEDWYQVYDAEAGYEDMLDLLKWNIEMDRVNETYYEQNMDNNMFRAEVTSTKELDSRTTLKFDIRMHTRTSGNFGGLKDTERGNFGLASLEIDAILELSFPGTKYLPDFLEGIFRKIWWNLAYKEQWERWEEFAFERLRRFATEMRAHYDLEPRPGQARRRRYEPIF